MKRCSKQGCGGRAPSPAHQRAGRKEKRGISLKITLVGAYGVTWVVGGGGVYNRQGLKFDNVRGKHLAEKQLGAAHLEAVLVAGGQGQQDDLRGMRCGSNTGNIAVRWAARKYAHSYITQ